MLSTYADFCGSYFVNENVNYSFSLAIMSMKMSYDHDCGLFEIYNNNELSVPERGSGWELLRYCEVLIASVKCFTPIKTVCASRVCRFTHRYTKSMIYYRD